MNSTTHSIRNKIYINEKITVNLGKYQSLYKLQNTVEKLVHKYGEDAIIYYGWHNSYKCTIFYKRMETDEEVIIRLFDSQLVKTKPFSLLDYIISYYKKVKNYLIQNYYIKS